MIAAEQPASAGPARKRIKKLEVMVADVVHETPDTATLLLFTGNDKLEYDAGHFLTIDPHQFPALERFTAYFEDRKGRREPQRAYSLSSAPHEDYLAITVKEEAYTSGVTEYPPLLSPLLVFRTPRGTRMTVTGFSGPYVLPPDVEHRTDHVVHVCAGSGGVPNFSILKHALHRHPKLRHTFIYGNKTRDDIIFRRQLDALAAAHPEKLRLVHALSRDPEARRHGPAYRQGRVTEDLLREWIPEPEAVEVFACGPGISKWDRRRARDEGTEPGPRFLETALDALACVGVPAARTHQESYG
ncbi:MAG: oxidoreductase [Acidobacteriota bacterium]|nr:oxidoreductase [Acidobacteriota bacterium]MDH3524006.1 oxidoreductase [Acidobacteriota bacterium]